MFSSLESWGKKKYQRFARYSNSCRPIAEGSRKIWNSKEYFGKIQNSTTKITYIIQKCRRKLETASQMSRESQNLVKRTPVNSELALVTLPRKRHYLKTISAKAEQFI